MARRSGTVWTRLLPALLGVWLAGPVLAADPPAATASIAVQAGQVVVQRPEGSIIGTNIEDLNNQLYGGLYSQLLYGEAFEESIDVDFLKLSDLDPLRVWVVPDRQNEPFLIYFPGRGSPAVAAALTTPGGATRADLEAIPGRRKNKVGELEFTNDLLFPQDFPRRSMAVDLAKRFAMSEQISRHWRKVQGGTAAGKFTLVHQGVFTGKQAQEIVFEGGEGEFGLSNAGLFGWGLGLTANQPYEGVLRIKSAAAQEVEVSLRDSDKVLASQVLPLAADANKYQRLTFTLTPTAATGNGRFVIALRRRGAITVDYAFLQPGPWGRFHNLPIRKDLTEAMLSMGVKSMRFNGSMTNRCPDGQLIHWKNMLGPRDERPPYHGWFNPYASHGFGIFEFLDFCEATKIFPMFGVRTDETAQDMADLIEYAQGGPETTWGARRVADGHPAPYAVQAIEIGNEEVMNAEYVERFKDLAKAIWAKDKKIFLVASLNVGGWKDAAQTELFTELAKFVREQGQEKQFVLDSHYRSQLLHADKDLNIACGAALHDQLAKALPGFDLKLWAMEENGNNYRWERGLAHAHNLNTLQRLGTFFERSASANTFQAWEKNVIWDQGRIHYTPEKIFFQGSYYVDRMFADEWLPTVMAAGCEGTGGGGGLDVLAKKSADGKVLTVYVVNVGPKAVAATIRVDGFAPARGTATRLAGESLEDRNTPAEPERLAPRKVEWKWGDTLEVPAHSFTAVRLEGN